MDLFTYYFSHITFVNNSINELQTIPDQSQIYGSALFITTGRLLFVCKMKNKWGREGQKTIFHNEWVFIQLFLLDILHILDILYRYRRRGSKTTSIKNK